LNKSTRQGILHATLIAPDLTAACDAYLAQLGLAVCKREELAADTARVLGLDHLCGLAVAWLANEAGEPILRLIEDTQAVPREPMFHHGWLALEVLVGDVDQLAAGLKAPFRVLGPPADLELSPAIRASQVLGPCGEMLYLTQIKAAVPPFDLPMSDARVSRPFIAVMSTPDRSASQAAWSALAGKAGWTFDTKITVLNRAHGKPLEGQYPVAVVPLAGQCMVEIDQVELAASARAERRAGLHSVAWRLPGEVDASGEHWAVAGQVDDAGSRERRVGLRGPAGEHIELVHKLSGTAEPE
jgi:catechol 2,3-dioxygenase-like lactoylglutathione lyase family enzyme